MPTVQRHTMLVEYAEHELSAREAADGEDVIMLSPSLYMFTMFSHHSRFDSALSDFLGVDILLQMDDVCRCLARTGNTPQRVTRTYG